VTNSPPDVGEGGDPLAEIVGVAAEHAAITVAAAVVGAYGGHLVEAAAAGAKVLDATGGSADPRPPKQTMHFRSVHLD